MMSTMISNAHLTHNSNLYCYRSYWPKSKDELLGVVLRLAGNTTNDAREAWKLFVTQWGRDPIWRTSPALHPMPGLENFPLAVAAETNLLLGETVPLGANGEPGLVSVAGHEVAFDLERKLWYCDIALNSPIYSPFVRLALARYQPNAIAEAKLWRVVLTDFVQLTPDRSVLVGAGSVSAGGTAHECHRNDARWADPHCTPRAAGASYSHPSPGAASRQTGACLAGTMWTMTLLHR